MGKVKKLKPVAIPKAEGMAEMQAEVMEAFIDKLSSAINQVIEQVVEQLFVKVTPKELKRISRVSTGTGYKLYLDVGTPEAMFIGEVRWTDNRGSGVTIRPTEIGDSINFNVEFIPANNGEN